MAVQPNACLLTAQSSDGQDRLSYRSYDAADELTQITSSYGTSVARNDVRISYAYVPGASLPATVTDAKGYVTTYSYDGFDRLQYTWYPNASTGQENTSDFESLSYDNDSNVTYRRQRDGYGIYFYYDALNNLTQQTVGSAYTYAYDNNGRALSASLNGYTRSFSYDALGRKTSETATGLGTTRFAYDPAGDQTQITWPDGFWVSYLYDPLGRLSWIREYGATSGPGQLAAYGYDNLGRLASAAYAGAGNAATIGQSFQYDSVSRLSTVGDSFADTSKNSYLTLSYGAANQIKTRTNTNPIYDFTPASNAYTIYQPNALNQIASITNQTTGTTKTFGYDPKGNLTSDGTSSYAFTNANQLQSGPNIGLAYDGVGHLVSTSNYAQSAQTQYLYDGDRVIGEYNGSGSLLARYVPGPGVDNPVVWYNGSGTSDRRWLISDIQGSIIAVANASGQLLAANTYDEYGLPGSSNYGRFQYTGQVWIPELGMYNYKARIYSPSLGRFMQTDPIGYGDGLNWYAYAHNDPVNGRDLSGLDTTLDEIFVTCCVFDVPELGGFTALSIYSDVSQFTSLIGFKKLSKLAPPAVKPQSNNQPKTPASKISCSTRLPNGQTVGQVVQSSIASIQDAAGPYDFGLRQLGAFGATVGSHGPIDFKNNFGPDPTGALGAAGNFAYGAIASGVGLPQSIAELGAGAYAAGAGKLTPGNPLFEDNSAAQNLPAGYASAGCTR